MVSPARSADRSSVPDSLEARSAAGKGRPPITVRRFAGHIDHVSQISHIRVAHLTDMHVGSITPWRIQRTAVELTNQAKPDLVAITGDFVCHTQRWLDQLSHAVESFDAPVIAVLGNHDHWLGASEVRHALRRGGAEVLDNVFTTITLNRQRLQIVGVDDAYTGHGDVRAATKGLRGDLPSLGLSHIAEEADHLWAQGVPLVLSGHTHAGQVTVARLHELSIGRLAGHRYVHGLYGDRQPTATEVSTTSQGAVYVGAGIGAAVMPFRVGERGQREVALFELGHEPGTFEEHHTEQAARSGRPPSSRTKHRRAHAVVKKRLRRERRASRKRS